MSRKVNNRRFFNNRYSEHDDRTSNDHIRKVSFKNTFGRIGKKRPDKMLIKFRVNDDDDVEMLNGGESSGPRRGVFNNRRRDFKNRPDSPGIRHQQNNLRLADWYQVRIIYGSKYEKDELLRMLRNQISPHDFNPVSYAVSGNDAVFYIDNFKTARIIASATRKINLNDGHYMIIKVKEGRPPAVQVDNQLKEKLKLVMAKRYVQEMKALDLSKFTSDPDFTNESIYIPLGRPQIMCAVMQIISENILDIVALNLNSNGIFMFDEATCNEFKKLKNLRILHLAENRIKAIHALNGLQNLELTEVILKKNPVCSMFKDQTHFVRYDSGITEVRKRFPKLTKLDDVELPPAISFDVGDEAKLPPSQAAFMCNLEGRGIVKAFLSQYFQIYDSGNRQDLEQAYHERAFFSQCTFFPPNSANSGGSGKGLNNYIQESRNLFKVTDYPRRKNRLHVGKENVVKYLAQLPKTQHDLSSFVVDLTFYTPALINLTVTGIFREPNASNIETTWPVRYFSRTFLIVPVGQGFCIVNDLLSITNASDTQIANAFKKETENSAILQSPPSIPTAPLTTSPAPSTTLDESVRQQMVQTLAARSGMNLDWSKKCLDETQWDFERAIWTFELLQKQGSIPAEAFV